MEGLLNVLPEVCVKRHLGVFGPANDESVNQALFFLEFFFLIIGTNRSAYAIVPKCCTQSCRVIQKEAELA